MMPFAFVAQAEVLLAPTRVVLENGDRSAELYIVNKGNEEAAFRISIENRRMTDDGSFEEVIDQQENEKFAKDFIRYSPRQVIMQPGESQVVRISARSLDMQIGEYRSHLRLQAAPTSAGKTLQSAANSGGDNISIQLIPIRSLTIPVIVRVGKLEAQAEIVGANLIKKAHKNGDSLLHVELNRTGTKSTYGNLEIYLEGQSKPVYVARGIAVYTPNTERSINLPLPKDISDRLTGRNLRIVYQSLDRKNPQIYSQFTTQLN